MSLFAVTVFVSLYCGVQSGCSRSNWWGSFDNPGLSKCNGYGDFMSGVFRNSRPGWDDDPLYLLEEAECCSRVWPWSSSKTQVVYADWWSTFDRSNTWATCPNGYFLNGLYRSDQGKGKLHNIEEGRCSKPADHPTYYGHCYDHDIKYCFDEQNICKCNDGYYMVGLYRGDCDWLYCLETLRCCKTAAGPEELDEIYKVKTRIMNTIMADLALLAHYMGYGWCSGCRAEYVGEDFRLQDTTWYADKSGRCDGYKSDQRLNMAFADWSYVIKEIRYGTPVIQELTPETLDSGTVYNNDPTSATKTITRTETSVRSVTHTTSNTFKDSHEIGVEVSYKPPSATGGAGIAATYKFKYESDSTTTDSTNNQQTNTFTVSTSKTLAPNSAARWSFVITKTRQSVAYTAVILVRCSAELLGFLRWGGGASNPDTNYHYQYRGSGDRPTFNYKFGDASLPFYTAIKRQSDSNARPWLWSDMINAHPSASSLISGLSDEGVYQFTLSGKFDDVIGKNADFHWDAVTLGKREVTLDESTNSTDDNIYQESTHIARPLPQDKPPVEPEPPKVDIGVRNSTRTERVRPGAV
ncbi:uncharacterized protein LOC131930211 [Physella acuta]|uniref:uncharacterized protein LOC131930211 n=1 Tax=Physella acuta TaxID=109671 RepID=UPI0027DC34B4|nr:uncharacterized protein LOC131930211 [Physella acuta]